MATDTKQPDALARDLSLVLPHDCLQPQNAAADIAAYVDGKPAELPDAIDHIASLIKQSTAPAVVGLSGLTIEAVRIAVMLAQRTCAKLLPLPAPQPMTSFLPAQFTASLGDAIAADLKILPRNCPELADNPIDAYLTDHVPNTLFVEPGIDALLELRDQINRRGASVITDTTSLEVNRAIVVLPASIDPCQISQWHLIAAGIQKELRLAVVLVPDIESAGNITGAIETITWLTGVAPTRGGLDFADHHSTPCTPGQSNPSPCAGAHSLLELGAVDLVIDTGLAPLPRHESVKHWVRIGNEDQATTLIDVHLKTNGLTINTRGQVMRFDGTVLWLCDDPSPTSDAHDDTNASVLSLLNQAAGEK